MPTQYTVEVATVFGCPRPQIRLEDKGLTHRQLSAAQHRLAATLEEATPASERWIVQVAPEGRVYLELGRGGDREIQAALKLLKSIANGASMVTRGDGRRVLVTVPSRDEEG